MSSEIADLEEGEPSFRNYVFSRNVDDDVIISYQVIKTLNSLIVWIGNQPEMANLSFGIMSPCNVNSSITRIFGKNAKNDDSSRVIALRLSKKLNKPVYVSFNVTDKKNLAEKAEKMLFDEIITHPEEF